MKKFFFFSFLSCVLCIIPLNAKGDYELVYYPCDKHAISVQELGPVKVSAGKIKQEVISTYTSATYDWLSEIISQQVKEGNIKILFDVQGMGGIGDTKGGFLVFLFKEKAMVLFNRGNQSYLATGHELLARHKFDHDDFSYSYAEILYPEIYVDGGEQSNIKQIGDKLSAKIIPLFQEGLKNELKNEPMSNE